VTQAPIRDLARLPRARSVLGSRGLPEDIAIEVMERDAQTPEIVHQFRPHGRGIRTMHGDPDQVLGDDPILHVDFVLA
jgi:hypothetical protein